MARLKPRIKIPYKRYERSFDRTEENNAEEEEGFVILKDITANPSVVTTNLKHAHPGEDTAEENIAGDKEDEAPKGAKENEVTLNKKIKIRRKFR